MILEKKCVKIYKITPFRPTYSPSPRRINFIRTNVNLLFSGSIPVKFDSIWLRNLAEED